MYGKIKENRMKNELFFFIGSLPWRARIKERPHKFADEAHIVGRRAHYAWGKWRIQESLLGHSGANRAIPCCQRHERIGEHLGMTLIDDKLKKRLV